MLLKGRYSRKGRRSKPTVRNDFTGVVLAAACKSSEHFQIAFHKLHDQLLVVGMTPAIAVNAADQHLTVVIDFH
jgi:hypothetical protein